MFLNISSTIKTLIQEPCHTFFLFSPLLKSLTHAHLVTLLGRDELYKATNHYDAIISQARIVV